MTPPRITSNDVAKMAGVSRSTVSLVINNQPGTNISEPTRQRVLEAAKALNYHPNAAGRKLVSGKSKTLGLILCQSPEQVNSDAFLARVIFGVEQAAFQRGFHVLLNQVDPDDGGGYTQLISENQVDGLILSGPRQNDSNVLRLHESGVPIMLLGQLPETPLQFVDVDAVASAQMAVRHLVDLGHPRIALITNAGLGYTSAQQRREGYLRAIENAGIRLETNYLKQGNYTPASGFVAMQELLAQTPRPTAAFVASDVVALGAMLAIKEAGLRIPDDIAVVGFDDIPLSEFFDPPLTTVRLPAYKLGWEAARGLISLINQEELDTPALLLDTELVVRKSTVSSLDATQQTASKATRASNSAR